MKPLAIVLGLALMISQIYISLNNVRTWKVSVPWFALWLLEVYLLTNKI